MAKAIRFLGVDHSENGHVIFSLEVTKNDGSTYQRQWHIPVKDAETITAAADPATAFQAYVTEHWTTPPAWASSAVGTTVTL